MIAHLTLVWELLHNDLRERYMGTSLGVLWLFVPPLIMLLVYGVVFGEVLQLRTATAHNPMQFAAWLFTGLTVFNGLAEVFNRAPTLLTERRELLLNTPLPAVLLPLIPVGASLVLELIAVGLLLLYLAGSGQLQPLAFVFYLPFLAVRLLFSLAFAYSLAVFGVFLRDLRQLIPAFLSVLLLVSAIVYPLSAVPAQWQGWFAWNPLAQLVAGYRAALLNGEFLWQPFVALLLLASALLLSGFWLFQRLWQRARYVL